MNTNFTESKKAILTEYIVIKNNATDEIHILNRSCFEKVDECETYTDYGQKVGCENAGCNTLDNSYSTELHNSFLADVKSAGFEIEEDASLSDILNTENEELQAFIEQWKKENESHSECTSYDYWDGHNWQSIVIENESGNTYYSELTEEEQLPILKEYENADFTNWESGFCTEETENYIFEKSQFQGYFGLASVQSK